MDEISARWVNQIELLESRLNSYWTIYSAVILGLIGWLVSSNTSVINNNKALVLFTLVFFFTMNLFVLIHAAKRLLAFENQLICHVNKSESSVLKAANLHLPSIPNRLSLTIILHLVVDVAVVSTVCFY